MRAEETVRAKLTIRKGDLVRVMTGRDKEDFKNKTSRVLSVDPVRRTLTVEHAHLIKRHTRANPAKNIKGGIVEREAPIDISNVMLVCPGCNKPTRVGYTILPDGKKARICRRCGVTLER
jgi:large subunit ribosomal protein L24